MTGHLAYTAASIGTAVANHLWQSTVFVAVAWTMTVLLRKQRAQARYGIWLAASVKFLIPFSLLIYLGNCLPKAQHATISLEPTLYSAVGAVGQPFSGLPIAHTMDAQSLSKNFAALIPELLTGAWLIGLAAVSLVWYRRWRQVYGALKCAVPAKNGREVAILRRLEILAQTRRQMIPVLRSQEMMEPGIFGIFRPVILWPERLSEHLENEHIEAILAHELMHVRRHDNLAAAIHMVVEALFWFHPVVWWMESRMLEERERACDEAVVQFAGRPEVYAESLLKACRFCAESPLKCVSGIASADLRKRIVRIMTECVVQKLDLSKKLLLSAVGLASLAVPVTFGLVHVAQFQAEDTVADGKHPKFAVVSIRQNKAGGPQQFGTATPNGYHMENMFLAVPILTAYVPQTGGAMIYAEEQIVGLPAWLTSDDDRYDINAKVDDADLADWQNPAKQTAMLRAMLRTMLSDRLKLAVHRTMKEVPVYLLILGKNGPKFDETKPGALHPGSYPMPGGGLTSMELKDDQQTLHYFGISMGQVATLVLNGAVDGRTIQDRTGLTGKYDITIVKPAAPPAPQEPFHAPDPGPSASSLAEQLGLKLEPGRGQVETLVIDHVERPSEN